MRFPTTISKVNIRNYHKAQLKRALNVLEHQLTPREFNNRLIAGLSVASNPKKIEEVRKYLHFALYQAAEMLCLGDCTEVYQLNLQFFSQTK